MKCREQNAYDQRTAKSQAPQVQILKMQFLVYQDCKHSVRIDMFSLVELDNLLLKFSFSKTAVIFFTFQILNEPSEDIDTW